MNEQLHNLLDGEPGNGNPIGSPQEAQTFAELRRLQEALRANAGYGGLSVSEKGAIGANLAAAIGLDTPLIPQSGPAPAGGSWLKNVGLLLVGAGLGAGIFFLTDSDGATPPPVKPAGIIIEAEATTPALFPFALAEPSDHDLCMDKVATLRDSLRLLEEAKAAKSTPTRRPYRSRRPQYEKPVTGE